MPADVFENRFDHAVRGCERGGMQAAGRDKATLTLAEEGREHFHHRCAYRKVIRSAEGGRLSDRFTAALSTHATTGIKKTAARRSPDFEIHIFREDGKNFIRRLAAEQDAIREYRGNAERFLPQTGNRPQTRGRVRASAW